MGLDLLLVQILLVPAVGNTSQKQLVRERVALVQAVFDGLDGDGNKRLAPIELFVGIHGLRLREAAFRRLRETELFRRADRNGDQLLTRQELATLLGPHISSEDRTNFELADEDRDDQLSLTEYQLFLRPDQSVVRQQAICANKLKAADTDQSSSLSWKEFHTHDPDGAVMDLAVWSGETVAQVLGSNVEGTESEGSAASEHQQRRFLVHDQNGDRELQESELHDAWYPIESVLAKRQVKFMLGAVGGGEAEHLQIDQCQAKWELFLSSIYDSDVEKRFRTTTGLFPEPGDKPVTRDEASGGEGEGGGLEQPLSSQRKTRRKHRQPQKMAGAASDDASHNNNNNNNNASVLPSDSTFVYTFKSSPLGVSLGPGTKGGQGMKVHFTYILYRILINARCDHVMAGVDIRY
jgi:hypothetical protein